MSTLLARGNHREVNPQHQSDRLPMFAVKSLDAVHHPGCAQALIFKETSKAGGGAKDDG
jgi:hypothetical protein